ncbi:MAG TPA: hypothetical protein VE085_09275 [Burkholderiales bacterium]|nr:hypothetical protein [Burkholderiales bacterium]
MASIRRSSAALVLVLAAATLAGTAAAQAPTRVRGKISAVEGDMIVVDQKTRVRLGDKTEIVYTQPIALADIKPGDFLGVTSNKGADGSLTAYEVRRFPKPLNPGHRPFDGRDDQTMTNATVGATVQSAKGRELTLTYDGGAQKILVPENASISMLVPGKRAHLVPGAPVNLTMDASGVALRVQVSAP